MTSFLPMRFLAAEITREKLFLALRDELPYALSVETEQWEEREDGSIAIHQLITVQRESHKKIVLGKGGAMLKRIGSQARKDIGEQCGTKVHLFLFVKVREDWKDKPDAFRYFGLEY